jgi:hypothetical protein
MLQQPIVQKWIINEKYTSNLTNSDKSDNNKTFASTIVANVVTERIWFDITGIRFCNKKIMTV